MADRHVATMNMGSRNGEPPDLAAGVYANPAANAARWLGGDSGPVRSLAPAAVRYIKLGRNGKWAPDALKEGIIPFGYRTIDHDACLEGKWDHVRHQLVAMGRTANGVSQGLRELKDFYGLPDDTLWVTIADGHLWWSLGEGAVIGVGGRDAELPARYRRTRAGWFRTSLSGEPLTVRSLSSDLTRTANYQMTICAIQRADYLLRRIRGERDPLFETATAVRAEIRDIADRMIRRLDWRDFEILVDLIFGRAGWQRSGVLGKNQADVDLILTHPTIGETAWVQIKSQASQVQLEDYLDRYRRDGSCDRLFFVCHSALGALSLPADPGLHLWTAEHLADAAIRTWLFDWLLERTR